MPRIRENHLHHKEKRNHRDLWRDSSVIKDLLLCVLSACMLILSFPGFNLEFLAWVAFVPAFFALKDKTLKQAFFLFYVTGVIFWSGIIYWLVNVTLAGTIALILYLALYFAIFGLVIRPFTKKSTPYGLILIPSVWVILEYLRGILLTGFPWALLGYSQYLNLPMIQIADITGAWGVSFLVMLVNVAIVEIIWAGKNKFWPRLKITLGLLVVFLSLTLCYGYFSLYRHSRSSDGQPINICVIQGNIPQELKWDPGSKDFIIDKYFTLTRQAAKEGADLIIWPEAALPVVVEDEPEYFTKTKDLVNEIKKPLLLGVVNTQDNFFYNSAFLLSQDGALLTRYDKLHLVPFGEYIPLRKTLTFLETVVPIGDFTPGRDLSIFSLRPTSYDLRAQFSVLICFEDLFSGLARNFVKRGAHFLVNITNDAWFGRTSAPYQHLQTSVFRAVENRVFLVRAANTGISGFISPSGKIISLVGDKSGKNIFVDGYKSEKINVARGSLSFYTRRGDLFIFACWIFLLYGIIRRLKIKD